MRSSTIMSAWLVRWCRVVCLLLRRLWLLECQQRLLVPLVLVLLVLLVLLECEQGLLLLLLRGQLANRLLHYEVEGHRV